MYCDRLKKLEVLVTKNRLDGIVLNPGASLTYLTGLEFHMMERPVVFVFVPGKLPALVLPELEKAKLKETTFDCHPFFFGDNPADRDRAFQNALNKVPLINMRIGVEPTRFRYLEFQYLTNATPTTHFLDGSQVFNYLRIQKDDSEVTAMRKAVDIAQKAFLALLPQIRIGVSEKEMANELTTLLLKFGSDPELPFQVIFSSGLNSANPHATPSDRKIQEGDLVVIDWGANYNGYASDLTRTLVMGSPTDEQIKIAESVLHANKAGREAGRPGIHAGAVDHAARAEIEKDGFGDYFTHRTGHGLGMEAHETPYMFAENEELLSTGMVYTVEPGIYLPEKGGVRIEDDVLVTENGSSSLSDLPRELYIIK